MAGKKLSVFDAFFLAAETREAMMHVGGLLIFSPPADAHPQLLRHLADELRDSVAVYAPWNLRLWTPELLKNPLQAWVEEPQVDLEYHVRRSALPAPGDERELGILVSRLHSIPIDFHRPPWEVHFIEGLEGGRFAMYFKIHHALVDGYTSMKLLARSLAHDPDDRDTPMFFARPPRARSITAEVEADPAPTLERVLEAVRGQLSATREAGRAILNVVRAQRAGDRTLVGPMGAPKTLINRRISRNRRFATQQYPIDRLRALARAGGGTINDVALAVCGGALRRYLHERGGLPTEPLTAMLPVNVRPKDDPGGGNAVGAILCSLATDVDEPAARLAAVMASTRRAKEQLAGLSRSAIMQYSAALMAPLVMQQVPTAASWMRPAFNVVVSNVPGPEQPLYFRGCRLDALYPVSIPYHGQGLNITINGYAGTINVGFTGCRDAVPSLQKLAVYSGEEVAALERELALGAAAG
ncbi:MAG: wax ester/triacylglycerol synthase family O-acyltransferase [Myxococcales bacterium]|nr:wax ester/triacylglycerol synthase family O-acyltransferase [Myxococcales bacterium]MBK7194076.1 wax ester/triacylglycerol synthase family O-acyltransferase [Myxococcales bacterium]MBP6843668.1 wax ester/triacylglycerol synthase family O-acyltransferase [Kofleriaceae bacterium]